MSDEDPRQALRTGILQWQKKWGVTDGDPILACLELFEIYLTALHPKNDGSRVHTFAEFRTTLEVLDERSRALNKHAAELTQELRAIPNLRSLRSGQSFTVLIVAVASSAAGVLVGKYLLCQ